MNRMLSLFLMVLLFFFAELPVAFAVPETMGLRITDVTTSSFSMVWMTDVVAEPGVEVYSDTTMLNRITDVVAISTMPSGKAKVAEAARKKGIMKITVSGLIPATKYYFRTVTRDLSNLQSIGYSTLQEVETAARVNLSSSEDGISRTFSNDLLAFRAYILPSDANPEPGLGDLMLLSEEGSRYPLSAFIGDQVSSPEGLIDLNNLFGADSLSRNLKGRERLVITLYRSGELSVLTHYRRVPMDENMVFVSGPEKGFFADINLDGVVDSSDFAEFKSHYRTMPDDPVYNPDFDFVMDAEGRIDARDFSKFAREYGRTNVE